MYLMMPKARKKVVNPEYSRWRVAAGYICQAGKLGAFERGDPLRLDLRANIDRRRDLDNLIKPMLDMLQLAGIVADDRWVDDIRLSRDSWLPKGDCVVSLSIIG